MVIRILRQERLLRILVFRNIDILEHDEDDVPYQGCMAIDAGDRNRVKNILFEDIRVESIQRGEAVSYQCPF